MKPVKIIQASDLHLDCRFGGLPLEKSRIRRHELKESFANAVSMAGGADIVLLPGDIFDNANFSKGTLNFITGLFSDYPETTFFLTMGNHDPYHGAACEALRRAVPENVVIFSDKAEYMELDDIKTRVYGMSFGEKYQYEPMIDEFEVIDDDYINILIMHGEIVPDGGQSKYNPVYESKIEKSGFDYIALGHVHECSGISLAGNTYYGYSGTHEPHGFDECGEKGIICGEVGKGMCRLRFMKTCLREYRNIELDVSNARSIEDISAMIRDAADSGNDLYRINLTGIAADGINIDCKFLETACGAFFISVSDNTRRNYSLDELAKECGLRGAAARTVLEELEKCSESDVDTVCGASDYLFELMDNGGGR